MKKLYIENFIKHTRKKLLNKNAKFKNKIIKEKIPCWCFYDIFDIQTFLRFLYCF